MTLAVAILIRWIHLASVIVLIGGIAYARFYAGELSPRFKRLAYWIIGAILLSGIYNYLRRSPVSTYYHIWFGVKVLLALHIFAVVILYKGKQRALTGLVISAAVIVAISGYLRVLF
ncbi:MAG TPA: hypothetical protein VGR73_20830 [Bryobacteraceae bacterium]|nr:hypothetical protein [Bryobacteraceae bacterium]